MRLGTTLHLVPSPRPHSPSFDFVRYVRREQHFGWLARHGCFEGPLGRNRLPNSVYRHRGGLVLARILELWGGCWAYYGHEGDRLGGAGVVLHGTDQNQARGSARLATLTRSVASGFTIRFGGTLFRRRSCKMVSGGVSPDVRSGPLRYAHREMPAADSLARAASAIEDNIYMHEFSPTYSSISGPQPGLADAVTDALLDIASHALQELNFMGLPGECMKPGGGPELSLLIDTESGSIGFVDDSMGNTWLIWQEHSEGRAGAMRCRAKEDPVALARFCYEILLGSRSGPRCIRVYH